MSENSESDNVESDNVESDGIEPKSKDVIVKKSTFKMLIIAIVSVSIIAAFMGGYTVGVQSSQPTDILIDKINNITTNMQKSSLPTTQKQMGPQIIKISADDDPMKGNPDAPITIIEFSDFQCPFCAKFHETTLPLLEKNYITTGKVNFVYRDFPIESIHPNAVPAALAAECADDQGKFWMIHSMIFDTLRIWQDMESTKAANLFRDFAIELDVNADEFDSCMSSGKYLNEIRGDLDDGRAYGVTGTPGFFVGNEEIGFTKLIGAQPFSSFQKVIDGQLNQIEK